MTRRKDGRYQAVVTVGGKRLYFLGKTKAEVQKKMLAHREQREHGLPFARIAADWWEDAQARMSPNSLKNYGAAYRRAVAAFELHPIADITTQEIATEIGRLALSAAEKTVKTQLGVYNGIFKFAILRGDLAVNPARDIPCPAGLRKTHRAGVSSEDLARVKANAAQPFGLFPLIALYTGLRLGEILSLTWDDVDLDRRRISVTKSLCWVGTACVVKPPKTETSISSLPILDALLPHLRSQAKKHGLIFHGESGQHMTRWEYTLAWRRYCKATGVTATAHQFRHTYATMLLEADVPAEKAQHLLRHAQIGTTVDVYAELREERMNRIAEEVYAVDIS